MRTLILCVLIAMVSSVAFGGYSNYWFCIYQGKKHVTIPVDRWYVIFDDAKPGGFSIDNAALGYYAMGADATIRMWKLSPYLPESVAIEWTPNK